MAEDSYTDVRNSIKRFDHPHWTDEVQNVCLDVAKAYHSGNAGAYKRGSLEVWTAAIIWSVVRSLWTARQTMAILIPLSEICAFYDVNTSTITQKAGKITRALGIAIFSEKFKTEEHLTLARELQESTKFGQSKGAREWDGEEMELSDFNRRVVVKIWITSRKRFSRERKLQTIGLVEIECRKLAEEYGRAEIMDSDLNPARNRMTVTVDMNGEAMIRLCATLAESGLEIDKIDPLDVHQYDVLNSENLHSPDSHYLHFIETYISGPDFSKFDTLEEAQEMMKQLQGKTPEQMQKAFPPDSKSKAWLKSLDAYRFPVEISQKMIDEALVLDPDCLEAHLCRIGWMEGVEQRIDALEDLLDIGDRVLGVNEPDFDPEMWWGDYHTRPYVRAMQLLGFALLEKDYTDEGIEVLMQLISMHHTDNLGVRYVLLEESVIHRKTDVFNQLLEAYPDESGLVFYYAKAIDAHLRYGNKAKSKKLAIKAFDRNPYPVLILAGEEKYPEDTGFFKVGTKEESLEVIPFLLRIADKYEKTTHWLIHVFIQQGFGERNRNGGNEGKVVDMYGDDD